MQRTSVSFLSRRGLLRLGVLAGLVGSAGCTGGTETAVTKPTAEKGNRNRLDELQGKAEAAAAKNKNKKRR